MDEMTILGVKPLTNQTGEQFYPKTTTDAVFQPDSDTGQATETTLTQILDTKCGKVSEATEGNFAGLDSNGNLMDSGKKASDFATARDLEELGAYVTNYKQNKLTFDSTPTPNSTNPVTSGGVFDALNGKQDLLDFDTTPTLNSVNPVVSDGIYRALEGKEDSLTFDPTPTWRSLNPVTSDGIYLGLQGKVDKIPVANSTPQGGMLPNVFYMLGTISVDTVFSLAPARENTIVNVWVWSFETDSIVPSITWPSQITLWSDGFPSVIKPNNYYEVRVMNGLARIIKASPLDASNSYNSDFNNDF